MSTISQVVTNKLCTGCGTCSGICPNEAIKMRKFDREGLYLPEIEEEKCSHCNICLSVCPGHSVNFEELNHQVFEEQPNNKALGNYQACYIGHSNETSIRYESASGGIASQILIFALERGIIDGALVVRMRRDKPLETEAFIAKTRKEVLEAAGSKYCPVAINEALKFIVKQKGKFAIVGLPCHIHGIRKAEKTCKTLKERIVLRVGLMCTHTVSFKGTEFLLEKIGIRKEQVQKISYRGKGWPGYMTIQSGKHFNISIPYQENWKAYWSIFSCFFFTPVRCLTCFDQTNELADISLGDAWLPEVRHEGIGKSIVISRTKVGENILEYMNSVGDIFLQKITAEKVVESQELSLKFKKDDMAVRFLLLKLMNRSIPKYKPEPNISESNSIAFARSIFSFLNVLASSNESTRRLLRNLPFPFFRLYFGVYRFFSLV